jgi:hypothetical protein
MSRRFALRSVITCPFALRRGAPENVTQRALSATQRAISVTQGALCLTQRALSVTQRALSVTQEAHRRRRAQRGCTRRGACRRAAPAAAAPPCRAACVPSGRGSAPPAPASRVRDTLVSTAGVRTESGDEIRHLYCGQRRLCGGGCVLSYRGGKGFATVEQRAVCAVPPPRAALRPAALSCAPLWQWTHTLAARSRRSTMCARACKACCTCAYTALPRARASSAAP